MRQFYCLIYFTFVIMPWPIHAISALAGNFYCRPEKIIHDFQQTLEDYHNHIRKEGLYGNLNYCFRKEDPNVHPEGLKAIKRACVESEFEIENIPQIVELCKNVKEYKVPSGNLFTALQSLGQLGINGVADMSVGGLTGLGAKVLQLMNQNGIFLLENANGPILENFLEGLFKIKENKDDNKKNDKKDDLKDQKNDTKNEKNEKQDSQKDEKDEKNKQF